MMVNISRFRREAEFAENLVVTGLYTPPAPNMCSNNAIIFLVVVVVVIVVIILNPVIDIAKLFLFFSILS